MAPPLDILFYFDTVRRFWEPDDAIFNQTAWTDSLLAILGEIAALEAERAQARSLLRPRQRLFRSSRQSSRNRSRAPPRLILAPHSGRRRRLPRQAHLARPLRTVQQIS